jgi:Right handed beta helix region
VIIRDNEIRDAIYRGIHLVGTVNQQITFERNIVDNAGEAGIVIESQVFGSGTFLSNTVRNMYVGAPTFANLSVHYTATQIGNSWQ